MEKYISILKNTNLFLGIDEKEITAMLGCLNAKVVSYKKNETILRIGETSPSIGMLLSGQALMEKEDFWGNRTIISEVLSGMIFNESYACLSQMPSEHRVTATEQSTVMYFDVSRTFSVCSTACNYHTRLIRNLIRSLAEINIGLTRKMECISKKTIRDRLLTYLSSESRKIGQSYFTIPFNRQQLADYLSVDRSALSNEISKLQKEGIITCNRNQFYVAVNPED